MSPGYAQPLDSSADKRPDAGSPGIAPSWLDERSILSEKHVVSIPQGQLRGKAVSSGILFAGIPYAGPPIGELRFRAPSSPPRWDGIRDCLEPGPSAMQQLDAAEGLPHYARSTVLGSPLSEDCLYLNVFTPAPDSALRPVMVWIHGGGLQTGSGDSWPFFEGTFLPDEVVLVTINYRLNIFGFLYLDEDFPDAFGTGNLGHLDQIAALQWVKENISLLGGDPGKVTVFGESAGGWSVSQLLAIPRARGLFTGAIVQSGGADTTVPVAQARERTRLVLEAIGVRAGDWLGLSQVPADELLAQAIGKYPGTDRGWGPFITTAGDSIVPRDSNAEIARGSARDVAVIVGSTHDEWSALRMAFPPAALPEPNYMSALSSLSISLDTLKAYYAERSESEQAAQATFETDWLFEVPTANLADALLAGGSPVWRYRFDWPSPVQDGALGAFHAIEVPFVFNSLDEPAMLGDTPPHSVAIKLHGAWVDFATKRKVLKFGDTEWAEYTSTGRHVMIINSHSEVVNDPDTRLLPVWKPAFTHRL